MGAAAQTLATLRVSSEVVPAGGMAQVKVLNTSPKPIISGSTAMDLSQVAFDSIDGINMFSPTGDVAGAAVVSGGKVSLRFSSPNGTFGLNTDYPIMSFALRLSQACFPGQVMPVDINPASLWVSSTGAFQYEYQQGKITVGGSISITDVVPGGGVLPPGATFSILGTGFGPKTSIAIRSFAFSSVQYVSPNEIRVVAKNGGRLDGVLIQAKNPDGSSDTYYSYMRGVQVGASAQPLLARTVPVFPMNPAFEALLPPTISPQVNPDYFTAIALQNPGFLPSDVTIQAMSPQGAVTGSVQLTLQPRNRIQRAISELFGSTLPTGGYLHIIATEPVQMLGLLGSNSTATVTPVWLSVLSAPALVAAGK